MNLSGYSTSGLLNSTTAEMVSSAKAGTVQQPLQIGSNFYNSALDLLSLPSAPGSSYPSWAKTPDNRLLYDVYQMEKFDTRSAAKDQIDMQKELMDHQYNLNQRSLAESWKSTIEGMKASGINPAAYFASNGGFSSAPTVSAGSAAQAASPSASMSGYLSSKYSSDSSAKASAYAANTQLLGSILANSGFLLMQVGKVK